MKKLLLLLLMFTGVVNGQIGINNPSPMLKCDLSNDGYEFFDLNLKANEILGTLNINDYSIYFYESLSNAQADTNGYILDNYFATNNSEVYIRVTEVANPSNFEITTLILQLIPSPVSNQVANIFQEDIPFDGQSNFDLSQQTPIILGGQNNCTVSYYSNQNDAYNDINLINVSNIFTNTSNPQKIYTRITNNLTGCYNISSFNLILTNPDIVTIPDIQFKARLLHTNSSFAYAAFDSQNNSITIDSNGDGEIQLTEAQQVSKILIIDNLISNFEGINFFSNLTSFRVSNMYSLFEINISNLPLLKEISLDDGVLTSMQIQNLPSLETLQCVHNNINVFNINNLPSLKALSCVQNNISVLNLSGFSQLERLYCTQNNLTSLNLDNLLNLTEVICQGNQISSLNTSSNINLQNLEIGGNSMSSLIVNPNLYYLECSYNFFTNLDLSYVTNLTVLKCNNNPLLKQLNIKNGGPWNALYVPGNLELFEDFELEFVCTAASNVDNIVSALEGNNNYGVAVNSYCSFMPGGNFNTITGNIVFDADNNGCDVTDLPQSNVRININDGTTTGATFVSSTGNYNFYMQAGSFDLTTDLENPTWFTASPLTATIPFANNNNNVTTQDFCISANGIHNDLEVVISQVMIARPGFDAGYNIVYKNKGNQPLSGNVSFDYDDAVLDFVSSIVVPNTQTTGNLTWDYSNLMPFESRSILVTLNVNAPTETPAVNINDLLAFNAIITPVSGDEFPDDNSFSYVQTVVGAYDPNNIICIEGSVVAPATIGNYLHYAINFENTGNFEAENVVVKTTIDPAKFNINTLQLLHTSAPVEARITNDIVEFIFKNINLPRSSGNPPVGGHGDVLFKIKTKPTLTAGSSVMNTAGIYFDYNFPINTNMATTTFANLSNSIFLKDDSISVFPNPTNSVVNINSKTEILTTELYDVQGRILETLVGNNRKLDISDKTYGIYFLKITTEKGSKVERIIKE